MKLDNHQLANLMAKVANERFGSRTFRRRDLMLATEKEVKRLGLWEDSDDELSGSVDPKSLGLANIDYRFSDLARCRTLVSLQRNVWRLASPTPGDHKTPTV
jgi:hypothetical protein